MVLGEQDPRKQGLKHGRHLYGDEKIDSESKIQENKDWNIRSSCWNSSNTSDSESKIQENKDWNRRFLYFWWIWRASESKIQENKDWNNIRMKRIIRVNSTRRARSKKTRIETRAWCPYLSVPSPRRARSKKTRIETGKMWLPVRPHTHSESKIQENKDWNLSLYIPR